MRKIYWSHWKSHNKIFTFLENTSSLWSKLPSIGRLLKVHTNLLTMTCPEWPSNICLKCRYQQKRPMHFVLWVLSRGKLAHVLQSRSTNGSSSPKEFYPCIHQSLLGLLKFQLVYHSILHTLPEIPGIFPVFCFFFTWQMKIAGIFLQ